MIPLPEGVSQEDHVGLERLKYLGREKTLKAIAALLGIGVVSSLGEGVLDIGGVLAGVPLEEGESVWGTLAALALSLVQLAGVVMLWRLHRVGLLVLPWSALPFVIASVWGFLSPANEGADPEPMADSFAVWMQVFSCLLVALAIYFIYLAVSPRSHHVVSRRYREEVLSKTPQIENRLEGSTAACLLIIAVFVALGMLGDIVGRFSEV